MFLIIGKEITDINFLSDAEFTCISAVSCLPAAKTKHVLFAFGGISVVRLLQNQKKKMT